MSHRFYLLFFLGVILLSLIAVAPNTLAYDTEPDPYWKTVATVSVYTNSSGPHWLEVATVEVEILSAGPVWEWADDVDLSFTNSTVDPENPNTTYWVRADHVNVRMNTLFHWQKADQVKVGFDTDTVWITGDSFYGDMETNHTWQTVDDVDLTGYSMEKIVPPNPLPDDSSSEASWMMYLIYLLILWLPGILLGLIAPGYGQIFGTSMMGIVLFMAYPSFIIVFFMIIIGMGTVLLRGFGED